MDKITIRNTKKEIWDAYQALIKQMEEKGAEEEEKEPEEKIESPEEKLLKRVAGFSIEKITNDISNLKTAIGGTLNRLMDRLVEEVKNLSDVRKAIEIEKENLQELYKIKAEAGTLIRLLETQDQRKAEFEKKMKEEEENLQLVMEDKKRQWARDEEEYKYDLQMKRRKEQDEYEFEKAEKEKVLVEREQSLAEREANVEEMEDKIAAFPAELEKATKEARLKTQEEIENKYKIANELRTKEIEKEREISKLKIAELEGITKKQSEQILNLEKQLALANQKAQELAVKIIEAGKEREKSEPKKESPQQGE